MPVTNVGSRWSSGDLIFYEKNVSLGTIGNILTIGDDAVTVGSATNDIDFKVFLGSSNYLLGDVGNARVYLYATSASDSGSVSVEPFLMESTMTGAGGVGGRARFKLYTNVALGSWSNALKAYAEYGANGRTAGMGSAFCAEMKLSAGTTSGTYAPLEVELVASTGDSTGTATGFIYCNADGTGEDSVIDSNAYLFVFGDALDAASGKFIDTDKTTHSAYGGIPIYINGVGTKWLAVVSD